MALRHPAKQLNGPSIGLTGNTGPASLVVVQCPTTQTTPALPGAGTMPDNRGMLGWSPSSIHLARAGDLAARPAREASFGNDWLKGVPC